MSSVQDNRSGNKKCLLKRFISTRRVVQVFFGAGLFLLIQNQVFGLAAVVVFGSALGIILGKFFCRWMCPIGLVMDLMVGDDDSDQNADSSASLYMYYKLGCPIAWISGLLNRFSLFRVRRRPEACTECGKCDKVCYVTAQNEATSLFKQNKKSPSDTYTCSRCLACIKACPTGALSFGALGCKSRATKTTAAFEK